MAKKVSAMFEASLTKNAEKGGAWLAKITITNEGETTPYVVEYASWTNASACKRWVKARVQELTPKKNCKVIASQNLDAKGKPLGWHGAVGFKKDA